jgi:zinc protease
MSARAQRTVISLAMVLGACRPTAPVSERAQPDPSGGAITVTDAMPPAREDAATEHDGASDEVPPTATAAGDVRLPTIHRARLANGVELAVVEHRALPVLHVRVLLRGAGSVFDPPARPGLASITADLLREGAGTMDSRAIAEAFDGAGARFDTDAGDDAVTLSLDTLPERAEQTLALVGTLLSRPTFARDELDRLRRRELDRLAQDMADPAWLSLRPFYRAVYGASHPYGRFDTTERSLRAITRDEVLAFHRDHIAKGGSITVIAVGSVTPEAFTMMASRAFGGIPEGRVARPSLAAAPTRASRSVFLVDRPQSQQAYVRVGRAGPKRSEAVWPAISVANQVLGASPSSRLFVDLRERRSLTYGVFTRVSSAVDEGTVSAAGSTRLERTGDFARALLEHLDRMGAEPVAADELDRSRRVVQNRFTTSIATAGDLASRVSELSLYGLGDDWFDQYRGRVGAVTLEGVREAGQRFFQSNASVIVVVGPARTLRPMLTGLGPVTVLRPGQ